MNDTPLEDVPEHTWFRYKGEVWQVLRQRDGYALCFKEEAAQQHTLHHRYWFTQEQRMVERVTRCRCGRGHSLGLRSRGRDD